MTRRETPWTKHQEQKSIKINSDMGSPLLKTIRRKLYLDANLGFLHLPKTGGTYVVQHESDDEPVISPIRDFGHACVVETTNSNIFPPKQGIIRTTHKNILNHLGDLTNSPAKYKG